MSLLIQYLVKLSISLSIVWLFYQLILRRLTFYNSNRWYLLGYTFLSFLIPFVNISPIIKSTNGSENGIIQLIPSVNQYTVALEEASHCPVPIWSTGYDKWDWTAFALMAGAAILLLRFIVRYLSFIRIRNRSKLISEDGIKIYQVDDSIIPFSFGNAVFINSSLHTEAELREIVRHEFVHVKQKHTIDIIWAELLCILNWYNPFAWLLKRSIRQNLEFIADSKVVENGIDKKQYQYLLLKVIGNNQYSIATQFNFSSLKKRIAMMNKLKSAKVHMLKFMFLLPLVAVLLLAFRKYNTKTDSSPTIQEAIIVVDAETYEPLEGVKVTNLNTSQVKVTDAKGYFSMELPADKPIHVNMKYSKPGYAEFTTHSFSLEKKSNTESINLVEVVVLKKGNLNDPCVGCNSSVRFEEMSDYQTALNYYDKLMKQIADTIPGTTRVNSKGYYIDIADDNGNCIVVVKDKNKKEVKRILLTEWNAKNDHYENLYGEIPTAPMEVVEERIKANNPSISTVHVKGNIATVTLKNGKTETYTLSLKSQKKAFEERCGIKEVAIAPVEVLTEARVATTEALTTPIEKAVTTTVAEPVKVNTGTIADDFEITEDKAVMHLKNGKTEEYNLKNPKEKEAFEKKFGRIIKPSVSTTTGVYSVISPAQESSPSVSTTVSIVPTKEVAVINEDGEIFDDAEAITIKPDILLTITQKTTMEELELFKATLKAKGFEFNYDEPEYKNGILVKISGTIKSKDGQANFVGSDFNKIIISQVTKGEKTYFRIDEVVKKKGVS